MQRKDTKKVQKIKKRLKQKNLKMRFFIVFSFSFLYNIVLFKK